MKHIAIISLLKKGSIKLLDLFGQKKLFLINNPTVFHNGFSKTAFILFLDD